MRLFTGLLVLLVLSVPGYVVLRSLAVDDGGLVDHLCALFVSTLGAQAWLKFMRT